MSFIDGFLDAGTSRLGTLDDRMYAARQDRRAEDQNRRAEDQNARARSQEARAVTQEADRRKLFDVQLGREKGLSSDEQRNRELKISQENNSRLLSRLNSTGLLDSSNAFNIDGNKLRTGIESGEGATTQLALDLLNQSGTFEDGVEAVSFRVVPGGGIAVTTKNSKGEAGTATTPADPNANGNVITLDAGRLGKIANTLYRTKIIAGLPEAQRNAFSRYRTDLNLIELERKAIQAARDAGGADQERDAIAAISEAETPEEREEIAQTVLSVSSPQTATTQQPSVSQPYDGPISFEELRDLNVTPEQFRDMTPEQKAQVVSTLTDRRRLGAMGKTIKLGGNVVADTAGGLVDSALDTDFARMLGLSDPGQEFEPAYADSAKTAAEIKAANQDISMGDVEAGFKALGEDPDYRKEAQQKQLDRLNKIDTADLTPAQVKRKAELEQALGPAQGAAPAGPVSTAAPQAAAQMDGKSADELNTAIDNGELNVTQEEAAAVAQNLQQQGIQNLQDLYQADMTAIEKMKALAFMRLFNDNATVDARLVQEISNIGETGQRSMNTAQAVTSANALRSGELDATKTRISAINANTSYQSLLRSARNDASDNVRQAATDVRDVMGDVFEKAYDESGNLVAGSSTAAQIFNQYLPELDALAKSATTPEAAGLYNKTKNQALSLAIQALASDGGSGLDYFTSMFRAQASGSPRATLDNLVSDGERIYYQEPDSQGNYRNVGNGVDLKTLTSTNPEVAKYIGDIVLRNRQARKQAS